MMSHGGARPGAGRPKGSKDKLNERFARHFIGAVLSVNEQLAQKAAKTLLMVKEGDPVSVGEIRSALEFFSLRGRHYDFEKHYEGREIGRTELPYDTKGVYVIYAPIIGRYKIGFSATPAKRMSDIQTACPVELESVAFFAGKISLENWLHKRYSKYRATGEWFDLPDHIAAALYGLSD